MRVRVVLALGLALIAAALLLDMSGSAPRTAGTDHINPVAFVATLQGRQELCQPQMVLPANAGSIHVLAGTYGRPLPAFSARFLDGSGTQVATGALPAGGHEGTVSIPLAHSPQRAVGGTLCIASAGPARVVLAGEPFPEGSTSETVAGHPQTGRVDVVYERAGSESWWSLLPALSERVGLGKATLFGDWTLAAAALLLAAVWAASIRLLLRELRE